MKKVLKWVIVAGVIATCPNVRADEKNDTAIAVKYMPEIHGTIRAKYEYQPQISSGRFEVRNARFSLSGYVHPTVAYKAEIDLSDEGSIKMLDAYARYTPIKAANFTIGQMRVPFTIDAHRSPHQQYFANRSFIAKQVGNVRDVGLTMSYAPNLGIPVILEGGIFNGSGLTNQKNYWSSTVNFSLKGQFELFKGLNLVLSTQKIKPESVRINMYDAGITFKHGNWMAEAEYLYKRYAGDAFNGVNAFDGFLCYSLPVKKRLLNTISFLGRFDIMTDHSDGTANDEGNLYITDYARKRITAETTLSIAKPFRADVRLNYEKYFYDDNATIKISEQDKIVMELMVRF